MKVLVLHVEPMRWMTLKDRIASRRGNRNSDSVLHSYTNQKFKSFIINFPLNMIASRPALGPTLPPIHWVEGALSPWLKLPHCAADHLPLVQSLRMYLVIPPLSHYDMAFN
jgi:hypothetical protein